jgi:hypothetical protein
MYEVVYDKDDGLFWIYKDNKALRSLGGFIEPLTPELIIKEIEDEV